MVLVVVKGVGFRYFFCLFRGRIRVYMVEEERVYGFRGEGFEYLGTGV